MSELSPLRKLARDYYLGVLDQSGYRVARARLLDQIAGEGDDPDDEEPTRPQDRSYTEAPAPLAGRSRQGFGVIVVALVFAGVIAAWWAWSG